MATTTEARRPDYVMVTDEDGSAALISPLHNGGTIYLTRTAGCTLTVPPGLPVGFSCRIVTKGTVTTAPTLALDSSLTGYATGALGAAPWTIPLGSVVDLHVPATSVVVVQAGAGSQGGGGSISVATRAALKAVAAANRVTGMLATIQSDQSQWYFDGASTATVDGADMVMITPTAGDGRWIRQDKSFLLKLPFTYATADAAVLFTVPTGMMMRLTGMPFWDVTTLFAGGSSSAIGVSSSNVTGYTVKGDILGGAAGDVEATLVAGRIPGTAGDEFTDADTANTSLAEIQTLLFNAGDTIRFDRITSAFTSGAGNVCVPVAVAFSGAVT